jgi:hypothetical protein
MLGAYQQFDLIKDAFPQFLISNLQPNFLDSPDALRAALNVHFVHFSAAALSFDLNLLVDLWARNQRL